jgi:hypothetical protein
MTRITTFLTRFWTAGWKTVAQNWWLSTLTSVCLLHYIDTFHHSIRGVVVIRWHVWSLKQLRQNRIQKEDILLAQTWIIPWTFYDAAPFYRADEDKSWERQTADLTLSADCLKHICRQWSPRHFQRHFHQPFLTTVESNLAYPRSCWQVS